MDSLLVNLGETSYPIQIGSGLLSEPTLFEKAIRGQNVTIVSNTTVAPLYVEQLSATLRALGKKVTCVVLPDGESYKTWETLNLIFDALLGARADRKTTLVALGGGVIGDMTGFAAACYMRGVPFIQVPTTLLAQVDSSVGGKTAINHPLGKNMIGAFYQPKLVVADLSTLNTLPAKELSAGLAEVIKHGAIYDSAFFDWIEANMAALLAKDVDALAHAVRRSCEIKAEVVGQDETEQGLRAILNFGHTFGHAIETGMGYGEWLHGEAVGCGMLLAARLSHFLGKLNQASVQRIEAVVAAAQLPVLAPDWSSAKFIELMRADKKASDSKLNFILLDGMGKAVIEIVEEPVLIEFFKSTGRP